MRILRIGTRSSSLALWQARWVADRIREKDSALVIELVTIKTAGEKLSEIPLSQIGSRGLFTEEIEAALLDENIDLAVHSLKDLPYELPLGLEIGAYSKREDSRDVFISKNTQSLEDLPKNAQIGTSSLRRKAQVLSIRPDLCCIEIRGNINTRLSKLDQSHDLSGIILAAAGVVRLGLQDRITQYLSEDRFLPAAGQGVIAIEFFEERIDIRDLLKGINHMQSEYEARAERRFLSVLQGGCRVPIGVRAVYKEGDLELKGMVASLDGSRTVWVKAKGTDPDLVGRQAAEDALRQGADQILAEIISYEAK